MSSRIELELTSDRGDGTWTWRAAGAKQPKGILNGSLLPEGAKVGDVLKGEAEMEIDGMEIVSVASSERERSAPELLEILGPQRKEELVTTQLVKGSKGGRDRGDRGGRGGRGDRGDRGDRGPRGDRSDRGDRGGRGGRDRNDRRESAPRAPRLRPLRTHRDAWMADLPAEQQPIGEQLLSGGVPAVREALATQNAQAKEAGQPEVASDALVALAEKLLPGMRSAEWLDRAEAAIANVDEADLRDLRSVVVASETGARNDEARQMADELRSKLGERVDRDHAAWLNDLVKTLTDGRTVRALRQAARPVKAGAPLPQDVATALISSANEALAADADPSRWAAVLDAVAFSPVRQVVTPAGIPENRTDELTATVTKLANRVPQIAALFGIEATPQERSRRKPKAKAKAKDGAKPNADAASAAVADTPADTPDAPVAEEAPAAASAEADPAAASSDAPEAPAADEAPAAAAEESPAAAEAAGSAEEASSEEE